MENAIKTAIVVLKERTGSTMASIIKFIQSYWPDMQAQTLRTVGRRMVNLGELIKTKKMYKLSKKELLKETKITKKVKVEVENSKQPEKKKRGRKPKKALETTPEVIIIKEEPIEDIATQIPTQLMKPKRTYRRRNSTKRKYQKKQRVAKIIKKGPKPLKGKRSYKKAIRNK